MPTKVWTGNGWWNSTRTNIENNKDYGMIPSGVCRLKLGSVYSENHNSQAVGALPTGWAKDGAAPPQNLQIVDSPYSSPFRAIVVADLGITGPNWGHINLDITDEVTILRLSSLSQIASPSSTTYVYTSKSDAASFSESNALVMLRISTYFAGQRIFEYKKADGNWAALTTTSGAMYREIRIRHKFSTDTWDLDIYEPISDYTIQFFDLEFRNTGTEVKQIGYGVWGIVQKHFAYLDDLKLGDYVTDGDLITDWYDMGVQSYVTELRATCALGTNSVGSIKVTVEYSDDGIVTKASSVTYSLPEGSSSYIDPVPLTNAKYVRLRVEASRDTDFSPEWTTMEIDFEAARILLNETIGLTDVFQQILGIESDTISIVDSVKAIDYRKFNEILTIGDGIPTVHFSSVKLNQNIFIEDFFSDQPTYHEETEINDSIRILLKVGFAESIGIIDAWTERATFSESIGISEFFGVSKLGVDEVISITDSIHISKIVDHETISISDFMAWSYVEFLNEAFSIADEIALVDKLTLSETLNIIDNLSIVKLTFDDAIGAVDSQIKLTRRWIEPTPIDLTIVGFLDVDPEEFKALVLQSGLKCIYYSSDFAERTDYIFLKILRKSAYYAAPDLKLEANDALAWVPYDFEHEVRGFIIIEDKEFRISGHEETLAYGTRYLWKLFLQRTTEPEFDDEIRFRDKITLKTITETSVDRKVF